MTCQHIFESHTDQNVFNEWLFNKSHGHIWFPYLCVNDRTVRKEMESAVEATWTIWE